VLLTGHSHQAWPDVARAGLLESWDDAARLVDDKWAHASLAAQSVREAVAARIGARADDVALGSSTHELICRVLSALALDSRRHFVTTDGEFHSLHRQLARLGEDGFEIERVPVEPIDTLAERMAARVRQDTAAVLCSTVLFETSSVVPHTAAIARAAHRVGAVVVFDAYHAFGVLPFRVEELGPDPIFVTAGGYKYAQWGEGNAWLRVPPGCELRPRMTGWFADFAELEGPRSDGPRRYGSTGSERFAGATYDPASHYRARSVIEFFEREGLSLERLRELSLRQTARILERTAPELARATPSAPSARGGFVAFRTPHASRLVAELRAAGVWVDARGDMLRLGPAPYLLDDEIDSAVARLNSLYAALG
jgi:kynureninase